MNGKFYIWRDSVDSNTFIFGVKSGQKYVGWTTVFSDGIQEMFGDEFYKHCKTMEPGKPECVVSDFEIDGGE